MPTVDPFLVPTPDAWKEDAQISQWVFSLQLLLDNLTREDGALETSETTDTTVVSHAAKLDFVTITQAVNLDTLESEFATTKTEVDLIVTGSPTYAISNDGTDRTFNANAAVAGTGIDVANAGPANVALLSDHDALVAVVQEQSDVIATLTRDLAAKGIVGT